jgi:hypothetical protein
MLVEAPPAQTLRAKTKYPFIPAVSHSPVKALIKSIPASAKWLSRALTTMLEVNVGPTYFRLFELLIGFETLHRFVNRLGARLPTAQRPVEVRIR